VDVELPFGKRVPSGKNRRLVSQQYVTAFVKPNTNYRNDARAIVEAASRPTMSFVTM